MATYFLRKVLYAIPSLLGISFIIFAILSLAPGDPLAEFGANPEVPAEVRENIKKSLGLDQPWPVRYVKWLGALSQGEFGFSFAARRPVTDLLAQRLPQTMMVVGIAYLIALVIAIPVGVLSAARPKSAASHIVSLITMVGISLPTFLTGLILILVFSVELGILPMIYDTNIKLDSLDGWGKQIKQSLMPIAVLALFNAGAMTRFVRSAMLENLPMDYVRTARAKGLTEWSVIIKHALRNSLIPVVTLIAINLPGVFTGAIITEQIFRVNGIGELLVTSVQKSDTPVVMAIVFIYAILVVASQLIADVVYGVLDPRIKFA
ncbi:MAG TPA: ABC transporter permease [Thermoflexales bacterium]|jgi:peptide/nickel transport system permease protein|nr:ABC transporter permease [Thermoflexales bacterium]HQZ55377.1 ABC transporter permease [Thermoflexales bacterium]HRA54871.1 ABC transporter permease [Thermoflexales bacterium]